MQNSSIPKKDVESGMGSTAKEDPNQQKETSYAKLLYCFFGIFTCYLFFGILQEKITRSNYGDEENPERFSFFYCLVLAPCLFNAVFARGVLTFTKPEPDKTPNYLYAVCAITYLGAMVASNAALKYVSYPFQVLGKACKPIPVMILGVILARKVYPAMKYLSVMLIVFGVAIFMYNKEKSKAKEGDDHLMGIGEMLVCLSLALDGMTGVFQEKMRSEYQPNPHQMMSSVNSFSILYLSAMALVTGEVFGFISFVTRYPYLIWNLLLFGITSALGQNFIFTTVTSFGPLTCSIMTTTRKFFTILGSVIIFANPLSQRQWLGVVLVFAGLIMDGLYGKSKSKAK
ncbi:putative solute carrier family 35 member B1 [Apostichopus japonicus]|uniref:Putative solute carrier family 35 member B1 n=1 Tax=Stichopus japonicus TaxID=307972 RepID=A0A2G8KDT0_STIJA|nr:putative solute carrier family 35 member B1 [Apostichopus japonicus]